MRKSGRRCNNWACRRKLLVPMRAPSGNWSNVLYLGLTKASKGTSRFEIAPNVRPSGNSVGISFKL